MSIGTLMQSRSQVALFFKWIKRDLTSKSSYGNSENIASSELWNVISIYALCAIVKKQLRPELNLYLYSIPKYQLPASGCIDGGYLSNPLLFDANRNIGAE